MKSHFLITLAVALICGANSSELSGIECEKNEDCSVIKDATCNTAEKLCECAGNSVLDATMQNCLPVALGAGSSCVEDVQCSTTLLNGGICKSDGKCGCATGMHYIRGRCWPSMPLGDNCSFDEECLAILEVNAVKCVENKCTCADGFYMREYSDCRKKAENVGDPCAINADCVFEGGVCNSDKVCENVSGGGSIANLKYGEVTRAKVITKREAQLKITYGVKALGDACNAPQDCSVENSDCSHSGYCICKNGFFMPETEQTCVPEIGGPCAGNEDCIVEGSTCDGTMCVCPLSTAPSASKQQCLKQTIDYNWACKEVSQCTLFGTRVACKGQGSTNCVCDENSRRLIEDNICWIAKGPGEECSDIRDCSAAEGDELITCVNNKCTCIDGFHPNSNSTDCNLDAPDLDDKCKEDGDCQVGFTVCDKKSKKCTCKSGYYPKDNACLLGVGGPCSQLEDCATAADSVCNVDGSKKCECPDEWIANAAISACLPIGEGVNATCSENQQCTSSLGEFSECSDAACRCKKRHHLVSGECISSKGLGDDCSKGYECYPPASSEGVICRNNKCACDYGLVPAENNAYCTSSAEISRFTSARLVLICLLGLFLRLK